MKEKLMKYGTGALVVFGLVAPKAFAAADPVIVNAAGDAAGLMSDNVVGIMTSAGYLGVVLGIIALFFAIRWALRRIFRG